jgi:hypothetical protein
MTVPIKVGSENAYTIICEFGITPLTRIPTESLALITSFESSSGAEFPEVEDEADIEIETGEVIEPPEVLPLEGPVEEPTVSSRRVTGPVVEPDVLPPEPPA